ncbi:MAG: hypothetical protein ACI4FV_07290 [Lachnospiraceae bacterium]
MSEIEDLIFCIMLHPTAYNINPWLKAVKICWIYKEKGQRFSVLKDFTAYTNDS